MVSKVYLVKTWELKGYDEHEVVAVVLLDRERALRFAKQYKDHFVEEWTIDQINSGVRIGSGDVT
jgi:hypothetical protein